jgi:hypothetical protein
MKGELMAGQARGEYIDPNEIQVVHGNHERTGI